MSSDDLETFVPAPRKIAVAGADFEILPLRMRQVPGFSRAITPVLPLLMAGELSKAISGHVDGMIEAVTIATGADPEWVENLFPHDFVHLAGEVMQVNADFFVRHVLPQVRVASAKMTADLKSPGASSSPGSSSGGTG